VRSPQRLTPQEPSKRCGLHENLRHELSNPLPRLCFRAFSVPWGQRLLLSSAPEIVASAPAWLKSEIKTSHNLSPLAAVRFASLRSTQELAKSLRAPKALPSEVIPPLIPTPPGHGSSARHARTQLGRLRRAAGGRGRGGHLRDRGGGAARPGAGASLCRRWRRASSARLAGASPSRSSG